MNHSQQPSLPTPPLPSIPLSLAGFLTEESIHVEGDAGNVHFSGHFNIHNNWLFSPGIKTKDDNPLPVGQKSSFSSLFSPLSPNTACEENDQVKNTNASMHCEGTSEFTDFHDFETPESSLNPIDSDQNMENEKRYTNSEMTTIRTRLRSGVLSPVSYVSRRYIGETSGKKLRCRRRIRGSGNGDVLERMLTRRSSFPVRPFSSYAVFVMDKCSSIKAFSFEEKSKRLGHMWAILGEDEKKVYVDMAFKDKARYKKQCSLLRKDKCLID